MSRKNYYFFGLSDPRDPEQKFCYIGSTTENYNVRLSKMVSAAMNREQNYKVYEWIRELADLSLRPVLHTIKGTEKISEDEQTEIHRNLIENEQAIGNCQLNMTKGRNSIGLKFEMTEETKLNISQATRIDLPLEVIAMLRDDGDSWASIAEKTGISKTTLTKRKDEIEDYISQRTKPFDDDEVLE